MSSESLGVVTEITSSFISYVPSSVPRDIPETFLVIVQFPWSNTKFIRAETGCPDVPFILQIKYHSPCNASSMAAVSFPELQAENDNPITTTKKIAISFFMFFLLVSCFLDITRRVFLKLRFPHLPKIKSAPTEADAQKTQTPIVAKLIDIKHYCIHTNGICIFINFLVQMQRGTLSPNV